jgi:hypothetical protein
LLWPEVAGGLLSAKPSDAGFHSVVEFCRIRSGTDVAIPPVFDGAMLEGVRVDTGPGMPSGQVGRHGLEL